MSAPTTAAGATDAASPATAAGTTDANDAASGAATDDSHEFLDGYQLDQPGQVDAQRGRAAYSAAEKQGELFSQWLAADQYRLQEQMRLDAEERRRRDADYADFRTHRSNLGQQTLQLNLVAIQQLSGTQVANLGDLTSFVAALAQMLEKTAGTTPPVTVAGLKAS